MKLWANNSRVSQKPTNQESNNSDHSAGFWDSQRAEMEDSELWPGIYLLRFSTMSSWELILVLFTRVLVFTLKIWSCIVLKSQYWSSWIRSVTLWWHTLRRPLKTQNQTEILRKSKVLWNSKEQVSKDRSSKSPVKPCCKLSTDRDLSHTSTRSSLRKTVHSCSLP